MFAQRNGMETRALAAPHRHGGVLEAHNELVADDAIGGAMPVPQARVIPPNPGGVVGVGGWRAKEREGSEPADQGVEDPTVMGLGSGRMRSLLGSHAPRCAPT